MAAPNICVAIAHMIVLCNNLRSESTLLTSSGAKRAERARAPLVRHKVLSPNHYYEEQTISAYQSHRSCSDTQYIQQVREQFPSQPIQSTCLLSGHNYSSHIAITPNYRSAFSFLLIITALCYTYVTLNE